MSLEPNLPETNPDPAAMAIERFVGHMDQIENGFLSGWIYSRNDSSRDGIELDVYFYNRRVATVVPTVSRSDLEPFFGLAKVGFSANLSFIHRELSEIWASWDTINDATAAIRDALNIIIVGENTYLSKNVFQVGSPLNAKPSVKSDSSVTETGELPWQFNADFYLNAEPDVKAAGVDPIVHYETNGEREGRRPNEFFDPVFYGNVYSDARLAGLGLLRHYREHGRFEGRLPAETANNTDRSSRTILFIGHDSYAAGAQKVLLEIVNWFRSRTVFTVMVILLGPGHLTSDFARSAKCYSANDLDEEADYLEKVFFNRRKPDIVYCNTVVAGKVFLSKISSFLAASRVVVHCHEMASVLEQFPDQLEVLVARADHWICASASIPPYLMSACNIAPQNIKTILPFIAPSSVSQPAVAAYRIAARRELGVPSEDLVIVGCGTVTHRKGADIFIEVAQQILLSTAGSQLHFIWIGDGEARSILEQKIASYGMESSIRFIGFRKDASDLLAIGDILFLSSREDPFPLVVLEAAQFRIPTVCFGDGIGIADFVGCGRGVVVAEREVASAAEALQELLLNDARRADLGCAAQIAVAENHFTNSAMRQILFEIYELGLSPAISIIVPNYNHEQFIDQRLQSILGQSIEDYEVIILDDCSTDRSADRISSYLGDRRFRFVPNELNSGSVFTQWQKGLALAGSDIIWVAESDDYCDADFLENLLPAMFCSDVMMAFCRSEIVDENCVLKPGVLLPYLDRFAPGFGLESFQMSGAEFVNAGFGALCVVVNASGVLLRKKVALDAIYAAQRYKMCGDWRIYLECCLNGSVAYTTKTTNYFRRHSQSAVHKIEGTDQYFSERLAIAEFVVSRFWTTRFLQRKIQAEILHETSRFAGRFDPLFNGMCPEIFRRGRSRTYLDRQIHVCFYVHGLLISKGGIERLFAIVASSLVDRGYRVSVGCRQGVSDTPVYPLRYGIEIVSVDVCSKIGRDELRLHLINNRVDVLIPMLSESLFENVIAAAEGLEIPIIASEHNDPWVIEREWWNKESRQIVFSRCQVIHLLSDKFIDSLPNSLRARVRVIPNPVTGGFFGCSRKATSRHRIIAVGRLAWQKQFDILIDAFSLLAPDHLDWDLVIFGEGDMRPDLESLIFDHGLVSRISLPGESNRLPEEMELSDIIVMPSRFEGFGMALVEGMAAGLPGVAFTACNGPNEIIRNGETGVLVDQVSAEELAVALRKLMDNSVHREKLGAKAREVAIRFGAEKVIQRWVDMITFDCGLE